MKRSAFTLVELLVVIAIIGLIASLSVIALGNARQKSRDSKRVADVKQVQTALELFFSDQGRYPTALEWATGSLYATSTMSGTTTYMERIPTAQTGGTCNNNYTYAPNSTGDNYTLNFCLEAGTGSLSKGINFAKAGSLGIKDSYLVGRWMLDSKNGVTDLSGNGNNGLSYGGLTLGGAIDNLGQAGGATLLDGVDDYISLGTSSLFDLTNSGTISLWVNIPSYPNTYWSIVSKGHKVADLPGYGLWYNYPNAISGTLLYSSSYCRADLGKPTAGTWNHLALTWNGSTISSFVNGALVNSSAQPTGGAGSNIYRLTIGKDDNAPVYFNGTVSDLRVYSSGLTVSEVKAIYDSTK